MNPGVHASDRPGARRFAVDLAATALLALVLVPTSFPVDQSLGLASAGSVRLWALLLVVPLAWRRVQPVWSSAAVYLVGLCQVLAGPMLIVPADGAVLVALYSVTVYGPRWAGRLAAGSVLAGSAALLLRTVVVVGLRRGLVVGAVLAVIVTASGLATFAFALLRRAREERYEVLRERADRLERERAQQSQLAAATERARIAREMHDVVAHSLSVVVAQADGGRYAAEHDPAAAVRALDTISETGRAALADMRHILGVLRTGIGARDGAPEHGAPEDGGPEDGGPGDSGPAGSGRGAALAPQPQSHDLASLIEQVRATGVRVSLVRLGPPRVLPPGMALAAYRICQEALTNAIKHAGPDANVTVLQQWGPSSLTLEISDDGRGAAADAGSGGHGLVGMRERVLMFGGTMTAGPRAGGGFRVRVELPLPVERGAGGPAAASPGAVERRW